MKEINQGNEYAYEKNNQSKFYKPKRPKALDINCIDEDELKVLDNLEAECKNE